MRRIQLRLVPLCDGDTFDTALASTDVETLRDLLTRAPALSTAPLTVDQLDQPIRNFSISAMTAGPDVPLYRPPAIALTGEPASGAAPAPPRRDAAVVRSETSAPVVPSSNGRTTTTQPSGATPQTAGRPAQLGEEDAVVIAYAREIDAVASFLRTGLSVLVVCDKLVVQHLWREMVRRAEKTGALLEVPDTEAGEPMQRGLRQRQIEKLRTLAKSLMTGDVLVITHLDLLAGGSDSNPSLEAREIIEILYGASGRLTLAFADRSLAIPEVLAARFDVRMMVSGVSRSVVYPDGTEISLGEALLTTSEAARFSDFDSESFYKNVSGMNPVRLRKAIAYAVKEHASDDIVPATKLYQAIRAFKVQTSSNFEVPDVTFEDIGGYDEVKAELGRAIGIMTRAYQLPNEQLRRELIPRGFIFYGPPGTGKTLFAKAVANRLEAAIQVISGPEVMDMYVGESERKVREIFAEARRNAPSVLVFDEFDSIAARRSGREDGGSRAGNAVVAQMLTEMDGFRPDVPMLIIGTTNRLDIIDEALLRPSRFQAIAIELPDPVARRAIADVHAGHFGIKITPALLEVVAAATQDFNGDEIRSIFRDACVGQYCEDPPKQVDARRLGVLVGKIRALKEQRAAAAKTQVTLPGPPSRPGAPPPGMTRLTPVPRPAPTTAPRAVAIDIPAAPEEAPAAES